MPKATATEIKKALAQVNKEAKAQADARGKEAPDDLTVKDVMESGKRDKVITIILTDFRKFKVEV